MLVLHLKEEDDLAFMDCFMSSDTKDVLRETRPSV